MSKFSYTTYIATTPEILWNALREPESTRDFWFGHWHETSWERGATWRMMIGAGKIAHSGEILEIDEPKRLVIRWRCEAWPELREEGYSRVTMQIEPTGNVVKLIVTHEIDMVDSKFIARTSEGFPMIFSSLKSLLETGTALTIPRG